MENKTVTNTLALTTRRLLVAHNIFFAAKIIFDIFFNVFLWKVTQDLVLVAIYNIILLLVHTLTFHACADYVKRGSVTIIRNIGLVLYMVLCCFLFVLGPTSVDYAYLVGAITGIANGMYWISYQITRFDLTASKNRGNYSGLEHGLRKIADIIMPFLGGVIITLNFWNLGYANLFLMAGILFLVSLIVGMVEVPHEKSDRLHIAKTSRLMWQNPDIVKSQLGHILGSFSRGGVIVRLLIPLMIINETGSEMELGSLLSIFAVIAIVSSFAFGKFMDYKHYRLWQLVSGLFYSLSILLLIFFPTYAMYVMFGAIAQVLTTFIFIPKRVISENLVSTLPNSNEHRVEYIVIREWFNIGFGRITSFMILLFIGVITKSALTPLLILAAMGVAAEVILISRIKLKL